MKTWFVNSIILDQKIRDSVNLHVYFSKEYIRLFFYSDEDADWVWDHFNTSVPMSTYLVAFAVTDFDFVNSTFNDHVLFRGTNLRNWKYPWNIIVFMLNHAIFQFWPCIHMSEIMKVCLFISLGSKRSNRPNLVRTRSWSRDSHLVWGIFWHSFPSAQARHDWPSRLLCWSHGKLGPYYLQVFVSWKIFIMWKINPLFNEE